MLKTILLKNKRRNLWKELCSISNLELAYKKARKHKTLKQYVLDFEKDLQNNLCLLRVELLLHSYSPKPLETFILRDPKTRKISKSDFRDRIIHHALCNIIEPIFEKSFIYDSYANRIGKGTLKAIQRFEHFRKKLSQNDTKDIFILKADIKHYFDEVDHKILLQIIKRKVKDEKVLWLIQKILSNYSTKSSKGMPLGNLTSQFFANVYLNELDHFVKHKLRAKFYIRYVDDFVILHNSKRQLLDWKEKIHNYLNKNLMLELHPDKSKVVFSENGLDFLGLKIFHHYKLLKRRNLRSFRRKLKIICTKYDKKEITYDEVYDFLEGWIAYTKNANTHNLRKRIINEINHKFIGEISTKEINRYLRK